MKIIEEFKSFVMRGNVIDLAVGVIIGGAFGKIVASAVEDLVMPFVGIVANADFSSLYVPLTQAGREAVANGVTTLAEAKKVGPVFAYGNFLTIFLNFLIVAFCIFMLIKILNRLHRKKEAEPAAPSPPPDEVVLLREIRDLLKEK
ncbi:large conductance mechanosensitive channel protein MscL [Phragmitibacter flavus]|uniref:Large-conductance mechanosensitive channel n=1 Tax=Phragmitibacter flavus TaxID=2576071 RepID=A0A5R8KA51_9BACT|nr:large conductance mechanosensitive channel protein MscL [Phragmitibacter flavus]TLD69200.1 large conductance mechanosensitive channel protein MscL [Phragmitibacter flavus]